MSAPTYEELRNWIARFRCVGAPEMRCGRCMPCRVAKSPVVERPARGAIVHVVHEFEATYLRRHKGYVVLGDSIPDDPVPVEYEPRAVKLVVTRV